MQSHLAESSSRRVRPPCVSGNAQHKVDKAALAKIERELDRLAKTLMDGVPGGRVKDKMAQLQHDKAEIATRLKDAAESPVLIHPNMANHYRDQSGSLRESPADEHAHAQASDLIRKLIETIVVTPVEKDGHNTLSIDLHGHLAGILSPATKAKRPLSRAALRLSMQNWLRGPETTESFL